MAKYTKITVAAPSQYEEPLTMLMMEQGAGGVEVHDPALIAAHLAAHDWDASVYEGQDIELGTVTLSCLLEGEEAVAQPLLAAMAQLAAQERIELTPLLEAVPEQDWQEQWKQAFPPLAIGERLWVRPYWDESPLPQGRVALNIDPGLAFGTGDHATTAMMLEMVEQYLQPGQTVLDFGCGSGILGIAALALGAARVTGVDNDPVCAEVVQRHLQLNHLEAERFKFISGEIIGDEKLQRVLRQDKAQLVLANINSEVVFDLARVVFRFMAPQGVFLCSGVIAEHGGVIASRLVNSGLALLKTQERDGWCGYACVAAYE